MSTSLEEWGMFITSDLSWYVPFCILYLEISFELYVFILSEMEYLQLLSNLHGVL